VTNNYPDRVRKHWTVEIEIDEHDGHTRAKARLHWRDQTAAGIGVARLDPHDRDVADIGDELAVARALSDLARRLMVATIHNIEAVTNEPVTSLYS
jgi:hypothetical protein